MQVENKIFSIDNYFILKNKNYINGFFYQRVKGLFIVT